MDFECTECGSESVTENRSEVFCSGCGLVVDEQKVDTGKEYRTFTSEERESKERVGSGITYTRDDRGVGSEIGGKGDISRLGGGSSFRFYRMKKWDKRSGRSRSSRKLLDMINRLVSGLNLPNGVAEESCRLGEKARELDLVQGRSMEGVSASLVYLVARNNGVPRTLSEVAGFADMEEDKLGGCYRYIARELDLGLKPLDPVDLLPRYARNLDLSGEEEAQVRSVIEKARSDGLTTGRSPGGIVGGCIYFVGCLNDLEITQREVAQGVGVTTVTVRKVNSVLKKNLSVKKAEKVTA